MVVPSCLARVVAGAHRDIPTGGEWSLVVSDQRQGALVTAVIAQ